MSSRTALVISMLGAVAGPTPDGGIVGVDRGAATCVSDSDPGTIVVCGQQHGPAPRMPLRDDRFAAGEVVRYKIDGAQPDPGPPGTPSRLGQTVGRTLGLLKGAITGEDPGF